MECKLDQHFDRGDQSDSRDDCMGRIGPLRRILGRARVRSRSAGGLQSAEPLCVGALVAALVTTLALWAYYRYAVPELRELLDWKFMRLL